MEAIEKVVPKQVVINIQGEDLTIKPFKFTQIPQVAKHAQPIIDELHSLSKAGVTDKAALTTAIIAKCGDGIVDLIRIATGKDQAWLDQLGMDDGFTLMGAIVEVNVDFFIKAVLPAIISRVQKTQIGQISL